MSGDVDMVVSEYLLARNLVRGRVADPLLSLAAHPENGAFVNRDVLDALIQRMTDIGECR